MTGTDRSRTATPCAFVPAVSVKAFREQTPAGFYNRQVQLDARSGLEPQGGSTTPSARPCAYSSTATIWFPVRLPLTTVLMAIGMLSGAMRDSAM